VQLKNVTLDVKNIIVTITVGVKCAQNASKCTILKEKIPKFLWGDGTEFGWNLACYACRVLSPLRNAHHHHHHHLFAQREQYKRISLQNEKT